MLRSDVASPDRRQDLAEQALDYVIEHGLISLSLRPLARAIGTSDRMLIYHFGTKDDLVRAIFQRAHLRVAAATEGETRHLGGVDNAEEFVRALWLSVRDSGQSGVTRLYLEACTVMAQGRSDWTAAVRGLREPWRKPLADGLVAYGADPKRALPLANLILDAFDGLILRRIAEQDLSIADEAAFELARLIGTSCQPKPRTDY